MNIMHVLKSKTKKDEFKGFIDNLVDGKIYGWASTFNNNQIEIKLYINNNLINSISPNVYRKDLKDIGMGNGCFGFELDVKDYLVDGFNEFKITTIQGNSELVIKEKKIEFWKKDVHLPIYGKIDRFVGNEVYGWVGCADREVFPHITANGKPCEIKSYGLDINDIESKLGLNRKCGFVARVPESNYGLIEFKLHAISMEKFELIDKKRIRGGTISPDSISAIFKALSISKKKDSVGIVVWEGTHNPIGRAQVLFNLIKDKRPSVIISFNIGFSDQPVWQPLLNSDCNVLILPWKDRELYRKIFKEIGLSFDLVWICKPRYPAFVIAEYISHKNTKYIIDLDDNELEMSSSKAALEKPYGLLSAKMAQKYIDQIPVRSVASKSLQDDFGGELVRHARRNMVVKRQRETDLSKVIRVGFIGTVRPHKGIVEAAKAVNELNKRKGYKIKFVVGGIYDPVSIRGELLALGCEVHGEIDSSRLSYHLQNLDVIITGFPDNNANKEILRYQISSKIGDGLSNERPVLVPEGISVQDLDGVDGVYLFNSINFERILEKAIAHSGTVSLDQQFTLEWNYQKFLKLEELSTKLSPTGRALFRIEDNKLSNIDSVANVSDKVVLVWKQHDTGLYGRRVDHIARVLAENNIDVTCVEIINQEQFSRYRNGSDRIDADFRFISDDFYSKRDGCCKNRVKYKTICIDYTQQTEQALKKYLLTNEIYPGNSKIVLFPAVPDWKTVLKVFEGYNIICDVVDNQLGWEKKQPLALLQQYKHIFDVSRYVIFNSYENRVFFDGIGFLNNIDSKVIPNWYTLPPDFIINKANKLSKTLSVEGKDCFDLVYSGNMNDRFDWDTISRIPKEIDLPIKVHLIGNCQRSFDKMTEILDDPSIIYHGPMREEDLLNFMSSCDLALMPHIHDEHSSYMNPMKINMYRSIGIPCIATSIPGVDFTEDGVIEVSSSDEFIDKLCKVLSNIDNFKLDDSQSRKHYVDYVNLLI